MIHRARRPAWRTTASIAALALAGCATAPDWKPAPPDQALARAEVPARLPSAAASDEAPALLWNQVVTSPRLQAWVTLALAHNRDLRVATANVQRARARDSTGRPPAHRGAG
jgi:multidrug efflux system outer membrane protein